MSGLIIKTDPEVKPVFSNYPPQVKDALMSLRRLILETAEEIEAIRELEETLKWGEPSYLTKFGSTIRINWKEKNPEKMAIYFKCTSRLVPTFKKLYHKTFEFEGKRAILFDLSSDIPEKELKHCISMALMYHKLKHLPLLGAALTPR